MPRWGETPHLLSLPNKNLNPQITQIRTPGRSMGQTRVILRIASVCPTNYKLGVSVTLYPMGCSKVGIPRGRLWLIFQRTLTAVIRILPSS